MKKLIAIFCVSFLCILSGCTKQPSQEEKKEVVYTETGAAGSACTDTTDCRLPTEYALQSNCPFRGACIDSVCRVICPLTFSADTATTPSSKASNSCEQDSDCTCSERGERTLACKCLSGQCVSVEK